jgi:hypothetical protein
MIEKYLSRIEKKIKNYDWLFIEHELRIDKITHELIIMKGRLVFLDYTILDFRKLLSKDDHEYRFQYMHSNGKLIKRWDTAPHHRQVTTFPHHIHEKDTIITSDVMNLEKVLEEIIFQVTGNLNNE